jgi:hypothetical protein
MKVRASVKKNLTIVVLFAERHCNGYLYKSKHKQRQG